jgi:hypothetical protein
MKRLHVVVVLLGVACGGSSSNTPPPPPPPPSGPAAPTGFVATPAKGSISLSWNPTDGAVSYEIERAANGNAPAALATVTATSYVDTAVQNGVTYFYAVRGIDSSGAGTFTDQVSAQPFRALCVTDFTTDRIAILNAEQLNATVPQFFGSGTGLFPVGLDIDPVHGEVFSANEELSTVTAHSLSAQGNAAPLRTFPVASPLGVAYDATADRILVLSGLGVETFGRDPVASRVRSLTLQRLAPAVLIALGDPDPADTAHRGRLFVVGGDRRTIFVYYRTDAGNTAPLATIVPAETDLSTLTNITAIAYDADTDEILLGGANNNLGVVVAYPASSNGTPSPSRMLFGGDTGAFGSPNAIAVDPVQHKVYVTSTDASVAVYTDDFTGSSHVPADAILTGDTTRIVAGRSLLAVDASHGKLVMSSDNRILTFDAAASGDTAPLAEITPESTGVLSPGNLVRDPSRAELLVGNAGPQPRLSVFSLSGAAAPPFLRSLDRPVDRFGSGPALALDAVHGEIFFNSATPGIDIFDRAATGSAPPLRAIAGANTNLQVLFGVAYDATNDAVVALDVGAIRRYARSFTDGNEAPLTTLSGANTMLSLPQHIYVDDAHGELLVADGANGVLVFHVTDDGNVAPVRRLAIADNAGSATNVMVDDQTDELFVISETSIEVYRRTASGNEPPVRKVINDLTNNLSGLTSPQAMAICN